MRRTSLSIAAGLAAVLLVSATPAQAAVTAKDAPSQKDIVKAFPELADAQFTTEKTKRIGVPGKTCEETTTQSVKSGTSTAGSSATVYPIVQTGVVELKSVAKAKAVMASYKKYVKKCATYTQPETGATLALTKGKNLRLGDESLTFELQSTFSTTTNYASTVVVRDGKRIGNVIAVDDAAVPVASVKPLAKLTAKKMR
ncbi:hypothetical protein [Nocardioides pinisoli]|uniref:PknH-like extracellular domain-containing protein n=1 Tax=Nocardioides pinisoli TaxID=2950279 RepID=A0ABT1KX69_9ACTN|nr:hypothetical protein [Nocardioides pinisoli]MCP3422359.1 hypothetical protein [Nocardioides pinisoli]